MTTTRYHATTPAIGDVLAGRTKGRPVRRTLQPVRRNSYHRGEREARFWRRTDRLELQAIIEAAKRHDLVTKKPGERNGSIGHVGIQILELMLGTVNYKDGTLEPSIHWIMVKLRRSRDAVVRALAKLRDAGFLEWLRRSEPIEDAEGPGPRVRQISNAYRIMAPASWAKRIAARVAQWRLRKRPPADTATPPPSIVDVADPGLAAALKALGDKIMSASPPSGQNSTASINK